MKFTKLPHFIALPVKMGDSFLLKDKKFSLLVDGGDGKTKIIDEIVKHTDSLDVVLCTHYDKDHIKGLLDFIEQLVFVKTSFINFLFEWGRFDYGYLSSFFEFGIKQIWLPDIFGRIQLFEEQKNNKGKFVKDEDKETAKKEIREVIEGVGQIIVSWDKDEVHLRVNNGPVYAVNSGDFDMSISTICRLVHYCRMLEQYTDVTIKWFSYTNKYEEKHIDHNLYAINCKPIVRKIKGYKSEAEMLYNALTRINRESLVFRYNKAGGEELLPNVLFTADSSFAFFSDEPNEEEKEEEIVLINNGISIVTTPHHGSANPEHKNVYKILKGKDFIFVRSSERHNSRPVEYYKQHDKSKRFCVRCGPRKSSYDEQKVCLEFENGKWHPGPNVKSCTCGENIFKELGAKHSEELVSFLQEELLTPIEVGEMLGLSKPKIYKMIKENKLVPFKTIGNTKIFLRHYIEMKKKELENL
ncbi:MBL fold metallo-hydrolase [Bacillus anthracis]|uniref:MBL fold metallo-hydrolase n=1 Tax=Bacillus anthracis TaxID=1392 RepID=UPI003D23B254